MFLKRPSRSGAGFTLIELLVAISIIAVLSTIGFTTFSGIQSKTRDSVRKGDLTTLATALALYQETNGEYLVNTGSCTSGPAPADTLYTDPNFKKFISGDLPADPKTKNHYCYETDAKGLTYKLYAKLDDGTDYILPSEDYLAQVSSTPTPDSGISFPPSASPTPTSSCTNGYPDSDGDGYGGQHLRKGPGTAVDAGGGSYTWTNPGNVTADDGVDASASPTGGTISNKLQATNFGFTIPTGATITGITASVKGKSTFSSTACGQDYAVKLIKNGADGTTNLATGAPFPTYYQSRFYGGNSNLWGTTWTPANINASNFGISFQSSGNSVACGMHIDYMTLTVFYTATETQCGAGYVSDNTDCWDYNANAKPGQTSYFTTNRGDGSFDYDCSGVTNLQYANKLTTWLTSFISNTCSSTQNCYLTQTSTTASDCGIAIMANTEYRSTWQFSGSEGDCTQQSSLYCSAGWVTLGCK